MVEKRNCSFCGDPIEPGTGKMYIKKDGTVYSFCSNKCKKNRIDLGRVPRRTRWTVRYSELKASTLQREKAKTEPKRKASPVRDDADSEETVRGPKKKAAAKKKAARKQKAAVKKTSEKLERSTGPAGEEAGEPAPTELEQQE